MYPFTEMTKLESKQITFIAIMGALGNVLSFLTTQLVPLAPNIPLGPVSVSLALDISHLATFMAALFGGPAIGGITGAVGGMVAAFEFGFSKGNLVTGIGLPLGKALTGYTAGLLFKRYEIDNVVKSAILIIIAYIPEGILTLILFRFLLPVVSGIPVNVSTLIGAQIVVKAVIEMAVLGFILIGLITSNGFTEYVESYFR
ncbi:ECF transporter S component [Candidatus Bathyarchaeota archaeon]|nr:ECF transporter S component [Candidatus Bathyarchaeota archaeon]